MGQLKEDNIDISSMQLGGNIAEGGDWYEHNLSRIAPHTKQHYQVSYGDKRICFSQNYSEPTGVVICIEGVKGHQPTTYDAGSTEETVEANVNNVTCYLRA